MTAILQKLCLILGHWVSVSTSRVSDNSLDLWILSIGSTLLTQPVLMGTHWIPKAFPLTDNADLKTLIGKTITLRLLNLTALTL